MKKAVSLVLLVITLISCKTSKETAFSIPKEIPYFTFYTLDNQRFTQDSFDNERTKLIIHFNSECDHCQKQAKWLSEDIDRFKDFEMVFISHEEKTSIKTFQESYHFNADNITFLQDTRLTFSNKFGIDKFPCILIYSKDKKFVTSFVGETKADEVLTLNKNTK